MVAKNSKISHISNEMRYSDLPLEQTGAYVSVAVSNDENHPASNVIDGNSGTFWMTTGLLPQSLTISFPQIVQVKDISLTSFKIRNLVIEKSIKSNPVDFEIVHEKSFKNENSNLQMAEFELGKGAEVRHLKFIITEAYDSFVAIQNIWATLSRGSR